MRRTFTHRIQPVMRIVRPKERQSPAIELATAKDFEAIADLNVRSYAEFASSLSPVSWVVRRCLL